VPFIVKESNVAEVVLLHIVLHHPVNNEYYLEVKLLSFEVHER